MQNHTNIQVKRMKLTINLANILDRKILSSQNTRNDISEH